MSVLKKWEKDFSPHIERIETKNKMINNELLSNYKFKVYSYYPSDHVPSTSSRGNKDEKSTFFLTSIRQSNYNHRNQNIFSPGSYNN